MMTSPRQRAANRANARKSTGPRSAQGRQRASLNSTKHGLARPIDASPWGEHAPAIEALLCADGYSETEAQDIARKILDYERNLDFQRTRHLDLTGGNASDQGRAADDESLDALLDGDLGPLIVDLWVAQMLERSSASKEPVFDKKLDLEIAKFFRKIVEERLRIARNEELEKLRSADRHLRRSALQLAKAIRVVQA